MRLENERSLKSPASVPCGLAFDGRHLWHADHERQRVYKMTPERGEVVGELPVPHASCDTSASGEGVWQVVPATSEVVLVDPSSGAELRRHATPNKPYGLAWDGENLWVGSWPPDPKVFVISGATGEVIAEHVAPSDTCGMEFADGRLWYTRKDKALVAMNPDGSLAGEWEISATPGGLAFDGEGFWWVDQDNKALAWLRKPEL